MLDRDKLREAVADKGLVNIVKASNSFREIGNFNRLVEAARLLADEDTLVISEVDGEWLDKAHRAIADLGPWVGSSQMILDALLAVEVGSGTQ